MDNFEQAFEATVTKAQARHEIEDHGIDPEEFFDAIGRRSHYQDFEIMNWLGY